MSQNSAWYTTSIPTDTDTVKGHHMLHAVVQKRMSLTLIYVLPTSLTIFSRSTGDIFLLWSEGVENRSDVIFSTTYPETKKDDSSSSRDIAKFLFHFILF